MDENSRSMKDEQGEYRIPLAEERLIVRKEEIETGRVRVRTVVEEQETLVREMLTHASVEVERVPLDVVVDSVPPVREEDGVTIIPVVREVLVVQRQLILTEEVRLKRTTRTEEHAEPVVLRTQRAVVEREETSGAPSTTTTSP
jgi:stress response protein YsnF